VNHHNRAEKLRFLPSKYLSSKKNLIDLYIVPSIHTSIKREKDKIDSSVRGIVKIRK
jgi:hypothetical protein